eukprot:COSAG02_NODE_2607_length_8436_cov_3.451841_8_plen_32_part_00
MCGQVRNLYTSGDLTTLNILVLFDDSFLTTF